MAFVSLCWVYSIFIYPRINQQYFLLGARRTSEKEQAAGAGKSERRGRKPKLH